MSERNDGGPAFPQPQAPYDMSTFCGVSVRDYFAAKAMQGLIGMSNAQVNGEPLRIPQHAELVARIAYEMADAMLKERQS